MKFKQISTHINKYQQIAEPEVCLRPSRDQMYHICYAQTTNISMTLLPQAPLNINTFLSSSNKYQQIQANIMKYKQISTHINKYQQIAEPEVCLRPSRDQMYHICYAQTTNISMTLLPQAPSNINNFCQVATNINKYKQTSWNTTNINTYQQISTNSRARSVPPALQRPNLSYMLCANYKYINDVASSSTTKLLIISVK